MKELNKNIISQKNTDKLDTFVILARFLFFGLAVNHKSIHGIYYKQNNILKIKFYAALFRESLKSCLPGSSSLRAL